MAPGTPTSSTIPLRPANFETLAEALDYAATGETGLNYYDARGRPAESLTYTELRARARIAAQRLLALGLQRGDRVALVADTAAAFPMLFFACQYAGVVPVPLPVALNLGARDAFVGQLTGLLKTSRARIALATAEFYPFLEQAARAIGIHAYRPETLEAVPPANTSLQPTTPDEVAYLQFTSGSTRFPRGVVIRQRAVMANLYGIVRYGLEVSREDRCVSWLPYYHDMGLVGFLLGPVASQRSVDYLATRDFAVRPQQWLNILSRNGGSISFAPPFGYSLCTRRVRAAQMAGLDLSRWRIAGVGAELIRPERLARFAEAAAPAGFDPRAFLPCYGLAEASLAVTFAAIGQGLQTERADAEIMARHGVNQPAADSARAIRELVTCGHPLPGHEIAIRDNAGQPLPDRHIGHITVRGPSLMSGYDNDMQASREAIDTAGWLYTGDLGCIGPNGLAVTGRHKDLIIVNGRNIWPEDLEYIAEQQPEVRLGDASAFAVEGQDGTDQVTVVLQCRAQDPAVHDALGRRVEGLLRSAYGIASEIEVVGPHTLPRTSSGKLSRTAAKRDYLDRRAARLANAGAYRPTSVAG